MGYRDYKLLLCDSQTVTEEVTDYYIDTGVTNPGWEKGVPLAAHIVVETAGSGTTGFVIYVCHKSSGAPTLGDETLASITAPVDDLTKGKEIVIPLPAGVDLKRYVGLHFANVTGDESMVCSAWIGPVV